MSTRYDDSSSMESSYISFNPTSLNLIRPTVECEANHTEVRKMLHGAVSYTSITSTSGDT